MLTLQQKWTLPITEVSGLTLRQDTTANSVELIGVSDQRYEFGRAAIHNTAVSVISSPDEVLAPMISHHLVEVQDHSNFEGVASDASRQVFILQEGADRIVVFDPELTSVRHTIALNVNRHMTGIGPQWHANPNARGEGLLLLKNGHILVAKQRDDPWIIEFGPLGSSAAGFKRKDALDADESFPRPNSAKPFDALAAWPVMVGTPPASINDLAVDDEGNLWVISSSSRVLAKLTNELRPAGHTATFEAFALPADLFPDIQDRAEGLVFHPKLGWLVSVDHHRNAANVFQLGNVVP